MSQTQAAIKGFRAGHWKNAAAAAPSVRTITPPSCRAVLDEKMSNNSTENHLRVDAGSSNARRSRSLAILLRMFAGELSDPPQGLNPLALFAAGEKIVPTNSAKARQVRLE